MSGGLFQAFEVLAAVSLVQDAVASGGPARSHPPFERYKTEIQNRVLPPFPGPVVMRRFGLPVKTIKERNELFAFGTAFPDDTAQCLEERPFDRSLDLIVFEQRVDRLRGAVKKAENELRGRVDKVIAEHPFKHGQRAAEQIQEWPVGTGLARCRKRVQAKEQRILLGQRQVGALGGFADDLNDCQRDGWRGLDGGPQGLGGQVRVLGLFERM